MIKIVMEIIVSLEKKPIWHLKMRRDCQKKGNNDNRTSCGCCEKISEGTKSTKLNSQVESAFEGARKITSEEYQAGDRFAVQRHEDNLKLGTEVRKYVQQS